MMYGESQGSGQVVPNLILDADVGIRLSSLESGYDPAASPRPSGLGTLSASGYPVIITDVVDAELGSKGPVRSRHNYLQWTSANAARVQIVPTAIRQDQLNGRLESKNAGELSIAEILNPANVQHARISSMPFIIASNDRKFDWASHGVPENALLGLVPLINVLYRNGTVSEADYKVSRLIMERKFSTLPGVDARPGKHCELLDDAELKQYAFQTPIIVPGTGSVRVTSAMGKPIRAGKP